MSELTAEELARISLLGDTSPWPFLAFAVAGELLYANPAALAAAAASGIDDLRAFLPDDRGVSADVAHDSYEVEIGGHTYHGRTHVSPDRERVLVYALDVTEGKKAEDALRLTQLSVDRAADLIHWITPDGRLLYVSDSNCHRHGYSREEMLAMTVFDLDPRLTPEAWRQHWADIKQRGSAVFETVHHTKDGDVFPLEIVANYVEHNGQEYNFAFARDISDRKQAEEALRAAKEQTEAANRDLERAVERANAFTAHNTDLYEVAQRRNRELEALLKIAAALTSAIDVAAVLSLVAGTLMEALGVYWCAAYDYDADAGLLRLAAHSCVEKESSLWQPLVSLADVPAMGDAVQQNRVTSLYGDDGTLLPGDMADMRRCGDLCQLYVPMAYGGEVVGLLYAGEVREFRRFGEEDLRLATTIAAQSAAAIETARAFARVRHERERIARRNRTLTALVDLSTQMRGLTGEDELFGLVGRVVTEALAFNKALVYLHEAGADADIFRVVSRSGPNRNDDDDEHYDGLVVPAAMLRSLLDDATRISASYFVDHRNHRWTNRELAVLPPDDLGDRAEG